MLTGVFSIVSGPLLGRLCDAIGNFPVFMLGAIATIIMVVLYTHLGVTPLLWVVVVNCLMWVGISSRMISSSALVSAIPTPSDRGAYMAISSSIQQVSGGVAAMVGGLIVTQTSTGLLLHFDRVGYVLVGTTLITLLMMYFISRMVEGGSGQAVVAVDSPLA
jgi:MFS family permease